MKRIVLVILTFCLSQITYSQTNTFPATGDVGIGTTTPDSKLHLYNNIDGLLRLKIQNPSNGTNAFTQISLMNDISGANLDVFSSNYKTAGWKNKAGFMMGGLLDGFIIATAKTIQFDNSSAITKVFFDMASGNVGIGTTSPNDKLEVTGNIRSSKLITTGSNTPNTADPYAADVLIGSDIGIRHNSSIMMWSSGSATRIQSTGSYLQFMPWNSLTPIIQLGVGGDSYFNGGNVGIGTPTPQNKLDVAGTIRCTEVKVVALPWPDFVFHPTYKLRTLGEVEQFIKTNNHLPEIPTESEVKEKGIGLGEMNAKLLQKVEELTLYMIEQQKIIEKQNSRIEKLEKLNNQ